MLIFGNFFLTIAKNEMSKNLIYYVKNNFRRVLASPTICESKDKVLLKNIETQAGVMGPHRLGF